MNVIQDLLGSMVLGGIILMMVVGFNGNIMQSEALQTFNTNVQTNLATATSILETDLRLLGYRISDSTKITFADTSKIVFLEDFNDDGTKDSITYYLGTTKPAGATNPRVRILYRQINTQLPQQINVGITRFRLWYYTASDSATTIPSKIRLVKVVVNIEGAQPIIRATPKVSNISYATLPYDTTYSGAYWERVIKPKNLR